MLNSCTQQGLDFQTNESLGGLVEQRNSKESRAKDCNLPAQSSHWDRSSGLVVFDARAENGVSVREQSLSSSGRLTSEQRAGV